jgi:hypothetical protein
LIRRILCILAFAAASATAQETPLWELDPAAARARIDGDARAVRTYRAGLQSVLDYVEYNKQLFPYDKLAKPRLLTREQREAVWNTWKMLLDYQLALDSIGKYHEKFYKLEDKSAESDSFYVAYATFLAQYRFALDFIKAAENNAELPKILNDPVPEIGLPKGTYDRYKLRYLNAARAAEFLTMDATEEILNADRPGPLRDGIERDTDAIWRVARGKGELMTVKNAIDVIKKAGLTAWFPVQAGVSEWMGDTKVARRGQSLISEAQIAEIGNKLEPGDILLERREWFLSNIGLPGYWPHAAIYIGTPEERAAYFADEEVHAWVRQNGIESGDFSELLGKKYPKADAASRAPQEHGRIPRVLEAISEGVSFTTLEHSADADAVAALRPRLSKKEKAMAVARAFHYSGRPYDFDFDFATDSQLVCTEVVYKAYEPGKDHKGLKLPLTTMLGRKVLSANLIAQQFHLQYEKPAQQTDLVLFVDGYERTKNAVFSDVEEFRKSWKRPKWHIVSRDLSRPRAEQED